MHNCSADFTKVPVLIGYIEGRGWTLTEIKSPRIDYTPQEFETKYKYLPYPLPHGMNDSRLSEYYAHRRKPAPERGKGFGVQK